MQPIKELVPDLERWFLVSKGTEVGEQLLCVQYKDELPIRILLAKTPSSTLVKAKLLDVFPDPSSIIHEVSKEIADVWRNTDSN
jgi:hypothetical protein